MSFWPFLNNGGLFKCYTALLALFSICVAGTLKLYKVLSVIATENAGRTWSLELSSDSTNHL